MTNQTETPKNVRLTKPGPLDYWFGPYASVAAANLGVPNTEMEGVNFREFKYVGVIEVPGAKPEIYEWYPPYGDTDLKAVKRDAVTWQDAPTANIAYQDPNGWVIWAVSLYGETYTTNPDKVVEYKNLSAGLKATIDSIPPENNISGNVSLMLDSNGWVVRAEYIDGSVFDARENITTYRNLSKVLQSSIDTLPVDNGISHIVNAFQDPNGWVIQALLSDGTTFDSNAKASTSTTVVSGGDPVQINYYPNLYQRIRGFVQKYGSPASDNFENFVTILMWGDSHFAREIHTSVGPVDPTSYPPGATTNNLMAYLFRTIKGLEVPKYYRYDKISAFVESGAFTSLTTSANWDDDGDRPCQTRVSTVTGASFSRVVPAGISAFNLIDRADSLGETVVTISVTGGNGIVQVKLPTNPNVWVEANGATFSQRYVDLGAGYGNTMYQRRIQFKKINGGGAITIAFTKGNNANRLLYWGFEEMTGLKPYVQIINVARGAHNQAELNEYIETDVFARKPTLILYEYPFSNMTKEKAINVNTITDTIWGDRAGNLNANSLKNRSTNWADFEVLLYFPHLTRGGYNSDGSILERVNGHNNLEIVSSMKAVCFQKNDVAYFDGSSAFRRFTDKYFLGNNYNSMGGSGITGTTFTTDDTHLNDFGVKLWASLFCPIFDINTL